MKIIHIITDLDTGGAEIMLYKLLASLHDDRAKFHGYFINGSRENY